MVNSDMVMPSQVASSFIVIKPQLLFELLVALFDPPSHFGKKDKPAKPCLCGADWKTNISWAPAPLWAIR